MTIEQLDDIAMSFLGWQCRLRQHAVRRGDGRPSSGMCPHILSLDGSDLATIVTVMVKQEPSESVAQFRHIVRKTHDPLERYESAVRLLQNVYYQYPREFSDALTATFSIAANTVAPLLRTGACVLHYEQANQSYTVPCTVNAMSQDSLPYQATYWHNAMFNPKLAGPVQVLQFVPDWSEAVAEIT